MDIPSIAGTLMRMGAPVLGGALGGPAGAAVATTIIGALASAFGTDPTPEAVGAALEKSDAAIVVQRVEKAEAANVMAEMNARLADVQDARAMQINAVAAQSWTAYTPHILAYVFVAGFFGVMAALFFKGLPESNIVMMCVGALISETRGVMNYFFGSTSSSKEKDATIRNMSQVAPDPFLTAATTAVKAIVKGRR